MFKKDNLVNLIIVIAVIALICFLVFYFVNKKETYNNIKVLKIDELKEKINNKESFVMIVSRDDCSHCKAFLPVANDVAKKYNITIYDISTTNLSNEDSTYLRNIANVSGTPTTVFIENGEEKNTSNRLVGNVKDYKLIEKLKTMGYINE